MSPCEAFILTDDRCMLPRLCAQTFQHPPTFMLQHPHTKYIPFGSCGLRLQTNSVQFPCAPGRSRHKDGIGRASDKVIGLVLCIHHWRCHLRGTRAGDSSCCSILRGDFGLPSRLAALCMRNAALGEIVLAAFSKSKTPPSPDNVLLLLSFPVLATKLQPTKSPSSRTQMP